MTAADVRGLRIEYDSFGPAGAPPVLLIAGLGAQMIDWAPAFCEMLASHGLRVVRFDNRDAGLSTHLHGTRVPGLAAMALSRALRRKLRVPYTLSDMADDAVGLLDALGIRRAHIVGRSMGGMIAQLVASRHPGRTASLVSIMASSGNPALPPPAPAAMAVLRRRPPDPARDEEAYLAACVRAARVNSGTAFPFDAPAWRAHALAALRRAYNPAGFGRQIAAVVADGDRRARLHEITAPTLVIHGGEDLLVPLAGGRDTAANIAGADMLVLEGMGHEIPPGMYPPIVEAIARHVGGQASVAA